MGVRVPLQVRSCGICGGHSDAGAGFLRVLRFPLPILIPPAVLHTDPSSGAGAVGQLVAGVPSGLSLNPNHRIKKKLKKRETRKKFRRHIRISF
jgi:hypothetical protein